MAKKKDPLHVLSLIYDQIAKRKPPKLKTSRGDASAVKKLIAKHKKGK